MINGADTQNGPNSAKQSLLTVNLSGVTIDGGGVYAEAGVLFRDAQGSISPQPHHQRRHDRDVVRHPARG